MSDADVIRAALTELLERMDSDHFQIQQEWGVSTELGYDDDPEHWATFTNIEAALASLVADRERLTRERDEARKLWEGRQMGADALRDQRDKFVVQSAADFKRAEAAERDRERLTAALTKADKALLDAIIILDLDGPGRQVTQFAREAREHVRAALLPEGPRSK